MRISDAGVDDVTKLINGGYNGLEDRKKRYRNCKRVLPKPFSIGGEMSFQRVILAHATHRDGVLSHAAAAVLHRHGIGCTVADANNMEAAIAKCQSEDIGWGDFVVVGEATERMFPDKLQRFIGKPVKDSDYRDAVGEDLAETAEKLARVLDGIARRNDVSVDLGEEFADQVEAGRLSERVPEKKTNKKNDGKGVGKGTKTTVAATGQI